MSVVYFGLVRGMPSLSKRYEQVRGETWRVRTETYEYAWSKISEDPIFGSGLSIRASETISGAGRLQVHNALLRAWFQGGLILALAFALIMLACLVIVVRSLSRREFGIESAVLLGVMIYGFFSPLLEQRTFWLIVLVAWASLSAHCKVGKSGSAGSMKLPARNAASFVGV